MYTNIHTGRTHILDIHILWAYTYTGHAHILDTHIQPTGHTSTIGRIRTHQDTSHISRHIAHIKTQHAHQDTHTHTSRDTTHRTYQDTSHTSKGTESVICGTYPCCKITCACLCIWICASTLENFMYVHYRFAYTSHSPSEQLAAAA